MKGKGRMMIDYALSYHRRRRMLFYKHYKVLRILDCYKKPSDKKSKSESLEILDELININSKKKRDDTILIASFARGYIKEWSFQVHGVFMKALGISSRKPNLTDIKNGIDKPYQVQNSNFNFKAGSIIYDSYKAYKPYWENAVNHICYALEITSASPAKFDAKTKERNSGFVSFKILKRYGKKLIEKGKRITTQDDFVRILIEGLEKNREIANENR